MDGFNEQLREVEGEMTGKAREYPGMSPEARRECQDRLDRTVRTLVKIQKDLRQADMGEAGGSLVVKVLGMNSCYGYDVKASHFGYSFSKAAIEAKSLVRSRRGQEEFIAFIPDGLALTKERNYTVNAGLVIPGAVDEWFITFSREEDARYAIGLKELLLHYKNNRLSVKFVKPEQDAGTRATFRKIGPLVERVKAIENELQVIGVSRDPGMPKPDERKYLDKSWFVTSIAGMKRAREAGQSLDHHAYGPLKGLKPVDMAKLQAQIKKLYDEECDCLITLREFQVNGVEFDF